MKGSKKITSIISAAALTLCSVQGVFCAVAADTDVSEVKISFHITDDMTPSKKVDITTFDPTTTAESFYDIPAGTFEKEGYTFSGWTVNGIDGFLPRDTYIFPEGTEEVIFEPVWYETKGMNHHNVTYNLEYKGETIEYPEWLKDMKALPGQIVTPDYTEIKLENAFTHGLILGEDHELSFGRRFVMPEEDVVITPKWFAKVSFNFYAGDVDRLNGSTEMIFPKNEGSSTELPASDRFSRSGFNLVGWLSDYDGKTYKPLETVTIPGVDVTFTAVWEAKEYNVIFKQGNGGANLKVAGRTDTEIVCPQPDITVTGKHFAGWKDTDGKIYEAGSNYMIKGALPGVGIMLTAVWEDGETPQTTEGTTAGEEILVGDANGDGAVNIADATAIVQFIANPDSYPLSEKCLKNADCYKTGDGVTPLDAYAIQLLEAGSIKSLPYMG